MSDNKLVYAMPGGQDGYIESLRTTWDWLRDQRRDREDWSPWFAELGWKAAKGADNAFSFLVSIGFIIIKNGELEAPPRGTFESNQSIIRRLNERRFVGDLLKEIDQSPKTKDELQAAAAKYDVGYKNAVEYRLGWLQSAQMLELSDGNPKVVRITELGREFLSSLSTRPPRQSQRQRSSRRRHPQAPHVALNAILYGPPGTGKTWETAKRCVEICDEISDGEDGDDFRDRYWELVACERVEFVTFHQSYAYEDFIEGIRPVLKGKELRYRLRDGIFKRMAGRASRNPDKRYVLIIDEINRGNVAKIFGELITLIEPSKREGGEDAAVVTLPYSHKPFSVPDNLYLIGTMNTADRGIALLDTALRRRFDFVERMPNAEHEKIASDVEGVDCQKLLKAINERIVELLDRERQIGHTYLMGVATLDELADAFRKRIVPLLQEYFYDDWAKLRRVLNNNAFISKRTGDVLDQDVFEVLPADDGGWREAKGYQDIYGDDRGEAEDE